MSCVVCMSDYTAYGEFMPFVLECGHSACASCSGNHHGQPLLEVCPICRLSITHDSWKKNFALIDVLERQMTERGLLRGDLPEIQRLKQAIAKLELELNMESEKAKEWKSSLLRENRAFNQFKENTDELVNEYQLMNDELDETKFLLSQTKSELEDVQGKYEKTKIELCKSETFWTLKFDELKRNTAPHLLNNMRDKLTIWRRKTVRSLFAGKVGERGSEEERLVERI